MFYISCDIENFQNFDDCGNSSFELGTASTDPILVDRMIDYVRTLEVSEKMTSIDQIHSEVFGDSDMALDRVLKFKIEAEKYSQLGFESYVSQSEQFSSNFKAYYTENALDIKDYLITHKPNLEVALGYVDSKISSLANTNLCNPDMKMAELYYTWVKGYLKYQYNNFYNNDLIELRDCNFWEKLGCGILAVTIGLALTAVGILLALGTSVFVDEEGNMHEFGDTQQDIADVATVLFWLTVGYYVGTSFYDWCCGKNDIPEQECLPPTMASLTQLGCNEFRYRVTGPSNYGATEWMNQNTDPASATTMTPTLRFSIPTLGVESNIDALIACLEDGQNSAFFAWKEDILIESDVDYFPLGWNTSPPPSFTYQDNSNVPQGDFGFDNFIYVVLNTPSNNVMSYIWSVNAPHSILAGGGTNDNFATIKITTPNVNLTTNVEATNNCLNETDEITAFTTIQ